MGLAGQRVDGPVAGRRGLAGPGGLRGSRGRVVPGRVVARAGRLPREGVGRCRSGSRPSGTLPRIRVPPAPHGDPPAPRNVPPAPRHVPPAPDRDPPAPHDVPPVPDRDPPAPRNVPPAPGGDFREGDRLGEPGAGKKPRGNGGSWRGRSARPAGSGRPGRGIDRSVRGIELAGRGKRLRPRGWRRAPAGGRARDGLSVAHEALRSGMVSQTRLDRIDRGTAPPRARDSKSSLAPIILAPSRARRFEAGESASLVKRGSPLGPFGEACCYARTGRWLVARWTAGLTLALRRRDANGCAGGPSRLSA